MYYARHQHEAFLSAGKRGESPCAELPLVILNPTVSLALGCYRAFGSGLAVGPFGVVNGGEGLVVLAVPKRPGRSDRERRKELRTAAREELVVRRHARKREVEVQVVAVTVGYDEVTPVAQHVALVSQLNRELEVVVGPAQALSPTERHADQLDVCVGVVVVFVVIVPAVTYSVVIVVIVVHPARVVVVARHVGLL